MANGKIAIISTAMTEFGDLYEYEITDIANLAIFEALDKIKAEKKDIESLYVGNMGSHLFEGQENLGNLIATYAGLTCPAFKIQAAGASGAVALRNAVKGIQSGSKEMVMVLGVEKMTEATKQHEAQLALASGLDTNWETRMGATLASLFAIMARAHMREYGTTREQIAQVVVKNHYNASLNPKAQYKNRVRLESVLNSKLLADPLRLFDACALSDGAASVILTSEELAYSYDSDPVFIHQIKQGFAPIALHMRESLTEFSGTKFAAEKAYKDQGITPKDISFAEVHDIFSIAEIIAIESLGLVEKGKGGIATENGDTSLEGSIPINTSGGLKGRGAPLGASAIAQIIELYDQFKGNAGDRQISDLKYGLAHSMGGTGGTSVVTLIGR
ncbi:MAG: thiolase domain-containing protein [Methanobacteriota archaeon]|nr:MAG: thiolase domain-containing protein [Euryarchaeota archaeon]